MKMISLKKIIKHLIPAPIWETIKSMRRERDIAKMGAYDRVPFDSDAFPEGINLIGNFRHQTGLGQSCRLLGRELIESGVSCALKNFAVHDECGLNDSDLEMFMSDKTPFGINLFHISPLDFERAFCILPKNIWDRHYNIAFWLWELEDFPKEWVPMINQLDEIWTPSEFVSNSIRQVTGKPVITVPYDMDVSYNKSMDRSSFGLPDDLFLYLIMYDTNSFADRKNPEAALEAYKRAFPQGSIGQKKTGVVLKIGSLGDRKNNLEQLRKEMDGYHLYFIDRMFSKNDVNALIKNCNVLISLHRAEGYGLVPAEAMSLGVPTVATDWSANTEYQTKNSACLIDYRLKPIGQDLWPYKKENVWAEADVGQAAEYIRKLFEDPDYYDSIRQKGLEQAESCFNTGRGKQAIAIRFQTIKEMSRKKNEKNSNR